MPEFSVGYWTRGALTRVNNVVAPDAEAAFTQAQRGLQLLGYHQTETRLTVKKVGVGKTLIDRFGDGSAPPKPSSQLPRPRR